VGAIKEFLDSFKANSDLSAKQFYAVELVAANTVDACNAVTDRAIGILQNKPRAGEAATVCHGGRTYARADGGTVAIAVGDLVGPSATGTLVKKATADNSVLGMALTACSADGMIIEVGLGYPTQPFTALT
jgi:hypothetical protein